MKCSLSILITLLLPVNLKETGVERIVDTVIEKKKNDKQ